MPLPHKDFTAFSSTFTDKFLEQLKKLERHKREMVFKKIQKILEHPELGKPLHAPLGGYRSERLEKYRIIYKISANTVEFAWFEHRQDAYQ